MIFTWLGLGMAFPYLILAAFPSLLRFLPKPGAWMETFKQLMGFMMLLVVIWLVWVFVSQSDSANILPLLVGFLVLSFGAWTYGKFTMGFKKAITKSALLGLTMISAFFGFYLIVEAGKNSTYVAANISSKPASGEVGWEKFSNDAINKLRDEGKGVFIDFTAKWCLLCQANLIVLKLPAVERKMEEMGVVKMMADWTRSDPSITEELARFGRSSVPLYIYYPPGRDSKPQVLPQVLTQDVVLESLDDAQESDLKDQSN
jgi:thiol:disulfide interchange protein DsbD